MEQGEEEEINELFMDDNMEEEEETEDPSDPNDGLCMTSPSNSEKRQTQVLQY